MFAVQATLCIPWRGPARWVPSMSHSEYQQKHPNYSAARIEGHGGPGVPGCSKPFHLQICFRTTHTGNNRSESNKTACNLFKHQPVYETALLRSNRLPSKAAFSGDVFLLFSEGQAQTPNVINPILYMCTRLDLPLGFRCREEVFNSIPADYAFSVEGKRIVSLSSSQVLTFLEKEWLPATARTAMETQKLLLRFNEKDTAEPDQQGGVYINPTTGAMSMYIGTPPPCREEVRVANSGLETKKICHSCGKGISQKTRKECDKCKLVVVCVDNEECQRWLSLHPCETRQKGAYNRSVATIGNLKSPPQCKRCKRIGTQERPLLRCGKCKIVQYCGEKCQKEDWRDGHRDLCAKN
jgi:hypothetical protein